MPDSSKNTLRYSLRSIRKRIWSCGLIRLAAYIFVGWWFLLRNPFGLSASTDLVIQNAIDVIHSELIQLEPTVPIRVVMISPDSIESLHQIGKLSTNDWPLSYEDHKKILSWLLNDKPIAIFYDIYFEKSRNTDDTLPKLKRFLGRVRESSDPTSIFFATNEGNARMSEAMQETLGSDRLVITSWDGYGNDYPLLLENSPPHDAPRYTAASIIYQTYCNTHNAFCQNLITDYSNPLSIQWRHACTANSVSLRVINAIKKGLKGFLTGFIGNDDMDVADSTSKNAKSKNECLPFPAETIANVYNKTLDTERSQDDEKQREIVFVGVESPQDTFLTPLFGKIAGPYAHAMATHNLLAHGGSYIRTVDVRFISVLIWTSMCIALFIMLARNRIGRVGAKQAPALGFISNRYSYYIFSLSIFVLTYFIFYHLLHISLISWLSNLALVPFIREWIYEKETSINKSLN